MTRRRDGRRGPIRVAYLNGSLEVGGTERQMVELATRLPRDRFAPEFVLLSGRGPLAQLAESNGVPVRFLHWARAGEPWRRTRRIGDVARYVITMRRGRFDIIDAWLFNAYAIAGTLRPITGVPAVIAGRRSMGSDWPVEHPINRILDEIARRRVDAIVANSDAVMRDAVAGEGIAPERIAVIRNGVDLVQRMDDEARAAIRAEWGADPGGVIVGCVANYKPGKGLEMVVAAASIVAAAVPNAQFVLVGEGPLRPDLDRAIKAAGLTGRVRLHGHEPDARRLLGAFDIVVQASSSEGLPNAILEAAAAGLPLVATDVGGTAEIVADGSTGRLVKPGDHEAMARAIVWLAASQDRRRAFGAAGRARVAERFGMDRFVAETGALYERVLADRASR